VRCHLCDPRLENGGAGQVGLATGLIHQLSRHDPWVILVRHAGERPFDGFMKKKYEQICKKRARTSWKD
jgi:hypothetical protein